MATRNLKVVVPLADIQVLMRINELAGSEDAIIDSENARWPDIWVTPEARAARALELLSPTQTRILAWYSINMPALFDGASATVQRLTALVL